MWLLPRMYLYNKGQHFRFFTLSYESGVRGGGWAWALYDTRSMFDGYYLTHQVMLASASTHREESI